MEVKVGQRWRYTEISDNYDFIIEIIELPWTGRIVQVNKNHHSSGSMKIGNTYSLGASGSSWTWEYLDGQDAPVQI